MPVCHTPHWYLNPLLVRGVEIESAYVPHKL
jgi:hypothetical protein